MTDDAFYLSVVASTRNDNHGGDLTRRTQIFVDAVVAQAIRHRVATELIVVEWNPPSDRPPLAAELRWPPDNPWCEIKILTVSPDIHQRFGHSDRLPIFQMIAKNAGVRRGRAPFVLHTNIDIVFSDALFGWIARRTLRPGVLYRCDRVDVDRGVPLGAPLTEQLRYCATHVLRVGKKGGVWLVPPGISPATIADAQPVDWGALVPAVPSPVGLSGWASEGLKHALVRLDQRADDLVAANRLTRARGVDLAKVGLYGAAAAVWVGSRVANRVGRTLRLDRLAARVRPSRGFQLATVRLPAAWAKLRALGYRPTVSELVDELRLPQRSVPYLHTIACGDFILTDVDSWRRMRGSPELSTYSMYLDALAMITAYKVGVIIQDLPSDRVIYHVDHDRGWTPDQHQALYRRMNALGIPIISHSGYLRYATNLLSVGTYFLASSDWGLAREALPERTVTRRVLEGLGAGPGESLPQSPAVASSGRHGVALAPGDPAAEADIRHPDGALGREEAGPSLPDERPTSAVPRVPDRPPRWRPLERRLPITFDLDQPSVSAAANVTTRPLAITTPAERWSVAAEIRLVGSDNDRGATGVRWAAIRVRIHVGDGEVGLLVIGPDGRSIVREVRVSASPKAKAVYLLVNRLEEVRELWVANASARGTSAAVIHRVDVFALVPPPVPAMLDPPRQSGLRPVASWEQVYGGRGTTVDEQLRAMAYATFTESRPMRWVNQLQIRIEPASEVCRAIYVSGLYEPAIMGVLQRLLKPGAVAIDVGAHIGALTLFASSLVGPYGKVIAFEPSRREFASLQANVGLNRLGNVTVCEAALYDTVGEHTMLVAERLHSGHNTLGSGLAYAGVSVVEVRRIRTTTLDDLVRTDGLRRVDVIKLDIEGSECRALRGARDLLTTLHPTLVVEVNRSSLKACGTSAEELEAVIRQFGYRLWRIDDATPALAPLTSLQDVDEATIVAAR